MSDNFDDDTFESMFNGNFPNYDDPSMNSAQIFNPNDNMQPPIQSFNNNTNNNMYSSNIQPPMQNQFNQQQPFVPQEQTQQYGFTQQNQNQFNNNMNNMNNMNMNKQTGRGNIPDMMQQNKQQQQQQPDYNQSVHNNINRLNKYDHEAPLLEELGVDFSLIQRKTISVLLPTQPLPRHLHTDVDLGGPLFFCLTLGVCLLVTGKLHFGYIFGFGTTGCILIFLLLNLMTVENVTFDLTCSILGYSLLPIVLIAFINIFISVNGWLGFIASILCISWCTITATRYIENAFDLSEQRYLVGYPVALFYVCFALISVF